MAALWVSLSRITGRVSLVARAYGTISSDKDSFNVSYNEGMSSIELSGDCCCLGSEGLSKNCFVQFWFLPTTAGVKQR